MTDTKKQDGSDSLDELVGCESCKHCEEGVDDNGMGWDLEQYEIWRYRECSIGHDIEDEPRKNCEDYSPNTESCGNVKV